MKKFHFIIAFITFIGYFIGLTLIIKFSFPSRYYSVPVRFGVALLMIIVLYSQKRNQIKATYSNLLFLIFWFFYLLSVIRYFLFDELSFDYALDIYGYSLIYAIIPFFFYSSFSSNFYLNSINRAIILSGIILSIISFIQYWGLFLSTGVSRISSLVYFEGQDFKYLSDLALSYSGSIVIGLSLFNLLYLHNSFKFKLFNITALLFALIPFLLGASRGSVFSLIVPFIFIFLFNGAYSMKKRIIIFLVLGFLIVISAFFADIVGSSVFSRTINITADIESGNDSAARLDIWYTSILQFLDSPIFGDFVLNRKWNFYPHNIIVEVLMSTGIVGFLPFLLLLFFTLKRSVLIIKNNINDAWISIIFLQGLLMSLVSGSVTDNIVFWSGMGLVFSLKLNKKYTDA